MASNNYFSHNNLQGKSPKDRDREAGLNKGMGENIHFGSSSIIHSHEAFMNSEVHRKNVLAKTATNVMAGVAYDSKGIIHVTVNMYKN